MFIISFYYMRFLKKNFICKKNIFHKKIWVHRNEINKNILTKIQKIIKQIIKIFIHISLISYLLWSLVVTNHARCTSNVRPIDLNLRGKSMDNKDNCNCDSNFSYISMLYDLCTRRKYPVNAPCWVYLQQNASQEVSAFSFSIYLTV